ncbi:DUF1640 domain-containing protein [Candidatus Poribacteria bacterium]|nr:DUF1640 domain-containing protein [Candidatus Poribacteria bacterium]
MKKIFLLALCFSLLTTSAFAELSQSDFERIQSIVEKTVEKSEKQIKEFVDLKIDAVNARIDAIDTKIESVNTNIDTKIESVNTRIDSVEKSVGRNFYLIIATFTLIVVAVGIPQAIIAIQSKKYDKLVEDVEMLKQQRIVSS